MADNDGGAGAGAGEQAGAGESGAGGRVEVPQSGSAPVVQPPAGTDFTTLIPAEFKDKPWVKDVKDLPSLFKRTDGLLTEIGKRPAGIPQETATEAEWAAFNKAWGVPEKPESYKLAEGTPEAPVDPKFQTGIKSVFHKAGISPRQASILEKGYNELAENLMKEKGLAAEKQNVDFDKLASDTFGERKAEALKGAKILIAKYAPESMKAHLEGLSNENLIVMAGVLDSVRKEFISEDHMPSGGGPAVGMTPEQKRAKGQELMASKAYQDPFHADHQKTVDEVQRLYGTK